MKRTVQEIADELGIDKVNADRLVKLLESRGLAKFRGERPNPSGKGKGQHLYEIESGAGQRVAKMIKGLEE